MTVKVQVAFQGGGAKLANLLAVAEALEDAHTSGKIEITRVAGTSAGSIVATLLASGVGIGRARESLQQADMLAVAKALDGKNFSWGGAVWKLLRGKPFASMEPLTDWLTRMLQGKDASPVERTVSGVTEMRPERKMELLVVSSDLDNRGSRAAQPGDFVVKAVADSCGIPFVFRTWKGPGYHRVDGGVCANLPVDFLIGKVQADGEVLAVSFAAQPQKTHESFFGFLSAVVDTAISAAEDKARRTHGVNVLNVVTDIKTFDFEKAVTLGLGEQYLRVKGDAVAWIDQLLAAKEKQSLALRHDPWRDTSPSTAYVMNQVGLYFDALETARLINYHDARLLIIARSLEKPPEVPSGSLDTIEMSLTFSTDDQPINMLSFSVAELEEGSSLDTESLVCTVTDQAQNPVPALLIPMRRPSTPDDRLMAVCFENPLPANTGRYTFVYRVRGNNLMRELQVKREAKVCYFPARAKASVEKLELIIQVPDNFPVFVSQKGQANNPREMNAAELPDGKPYGMSTYGFAACNVRKVDDSALWSMLVFCRPSVSA